MVIAEDNWHLELMYIFSRKKIFFETLENAIGEFSDDKKKLENSYPGHGIWHIQEFWMD